VATGVTVVVEDEDEDEDRGVRLRTLGEADGPGEEVEGVKL
jgi:hypothetical protein